MRFTMSKIHVLLLLFQLAPAFCVDLKLVHEWRQLDFQFPNQQTRDHALQNGLFQPGNPLPIDVAVHYKHNGSRIFVTIPRFSQGVPMTLTTVTRSTAGDGPLLAPYPDYVTHSSHGRNCNGLTSVFRVAIDKCNRMWVLDTGMIESTRHCPPQLLAYNLETDKLILRYRFPPEQYRSDLSLFVTPIVDVQDTTGKCRDTFVYIADVTAQGLLVFDLRNERSWRINNKLFYPNPDWGTFTIQGESFDLMDGILGIALSPLPETSGRIFGLLHNPSPSAPRSPSTLISRKMYFHALASNTENMVETSVLQNGSMWIENPADSPRSFETIGRRNTQSPAQAMDNKGNLFFGLVNPIAIACWDSSTQYEPRNIHIIAQNDETLQFASGMKIIDNLIGGQELWVVTNSLQKLYNGSLNNRTVNFRIQALQTEGLLDSNGRCSPTRSISQGRSSGYAPLIFS